MRKNNYLSESEVNLSLFKTRPDILKSESANVHFHTNTFHPMRNENIFAFSQSFRRFRGLLIRSLVTPDEVYFSQTNYSQRKLTKI